MTYFKRFAVIMLVVAMILSTAGLAGAAPDTIGTDYEEAVEYLMGLGVVAGFPDGNFHPTRTLTRAEVAKVIVIAKQGEQGEQNAGFLKGAFSFSDVPAAHWASGYIMLAKNLGIVDGYPDGTYLPENSVTYAELVKMLVEAAGLEPAAGAWPTNYVTAATNAGIAGAADGWTANEPATRGDMALMSAFTVEEVADPETGKTLAQNVFGAALAETIEVSPETQTVAIGERVPLVAVAKDADGAVLEGLVFNWMSSDPTKAAVGNDGSFVGSASGVYTVTAKIGDTEGTAVISVYGAATGLKATASSETVIANGASEVTITVEVVDEHGIRVMKDDSTEITMTHDESEGAVELEDTNLTVEDGAVEFEVTATTNPDVTDILEFEADDDDFETTTISISTVEQIATTIQLKADPAELTANISEDGTVTATVVDQMGEPVLFGTYDITFSVSGNGELDGDNDDIVLSTVGQEATVDVNSVQGEAGGFTITASSDELTTASVIIDTYVAGTPEALKVVVDDGKGEAGGIDDVEITVMLVDKNGRATPVKDAAGGLDIEFEPEDDDALFNDLATINIPENASSAKLTFGGDTAGTFEIEVSDVEGTYTSTAFECTIEPGDVSGVVLIPALETATPLILLQVANPVMQFTAELQDAYENPVPEAGVEVQFSQLAGSSTRDLKFSPDDGKLKTDASGKATVSVEAPPYVEELYGVKVEIDADGNGELDESDETITDVIKVTDVVPKSISIQIIKEGTTSAISKIAANADDAAKVTITVKDSEGEGIDGSELEITFSNDGDHVKVDPGAPLTEEDKDGVYTGVTGGGAEPGELTFTFTGAEAGYFTIKVKSLNRPEEAMSPRTKGFRTIAGNVVAGVALAMADGSSLSDNELEANDPVKLKVMPTDNGGNAIRAPGVVDVALAVDAAGIGVFYDPTPAAFGEFRLSSAGVGLDPTAPDTIKIAKRSSSKTIYFVIDEDADVDFEFLAGTDAFTAYQIAAPSPSAGTTEVTFTVVDGDGDPISGVVVDFTTDAAAPVTLVHESATTNSAGEVTAEMSQAPATGETVTATIRNARDGQEPGVEIEATVAWLP